MEVGYFTNSWRYNGVCYPLTIPVMQPPRYSWRDSKILQGRNSSRNLLVQVAGASLLGSNRLAVQNPSSANQYEFLHPNYVYSGIANTHTCNGIDAPRIGTYIHSYIYIYVYVTYIYIYICIHVHSYMYTCVCVQFH